MYKLLLATGQRDILDMFSQYTEWESIGFRMPRTAANAQEAAACLEKHRVDAIAFRLDAQEENKLYQKLMKSYPELPIFPLGSTMAEQITILHDLRVLLNRTHADFSNEDYGVADMMKLCRNDFMRALLSGAITDGREIKTRVKLLRLNIDADKPCVLLDMELLKGEEYLAGRWHYGSERLEVALRNFFGAEMNGLLISVAVVTPQLVRLLACPKEGQGEGGESSTGKVVGHVQEAIREIREYLSLEVTMGPIRVLKNITDLSVRP